MNEAAQQKAFDAEVKAQAKRRNAIQQDTVDQVVAALRQAFTNINKKLQDQPSDYQLWHFPRVKKAIETALLAFGETAGAHASAGQARAFDAGEDLVVNPLKAAGLNIEGIFPRIDKGQLLAMQAFLTNKMMDVGHDAITRINGQLALHIIGSQSVEDTIKGIQDVEPMARKRATTIIRTEIGRAYAVASQDRLEQAALHVPGLKKQWRRSGKIHSRRNHDLADGQIRSVDQPFIMGTGAVVEGQEGNGARLMFPHDPKAPAAETVNCGCISLPYRDEWKDVMQTPGKRRFTDEEIALNPLKADLANLDSAPLVQDIFGDQAISG